MLSVFSRYLAVVLCSGSSSSVSAVRLPRQSSPRWRYFVPKTNIYAYIFFFGCLLRHGPPSRDQVKGAWRPARQYAASFFFLFELGLACPHTYSFPLRVWGERSTRSPPFRWSSPCPWKWVYLAPWEASSWREDRRSVLLLPNQVSGGGT